MRPLNSACNKRLITLTVITLSGFYCTWKTGIEAFLDRRLRPMNNVFSSATKFLFEVPRMIFDWESLLTAEADGRAEVGSSGSSSTDSPRSLARVWKVLKMAPLVLKWKKVFAKTIAKDFFKKCFEHFMECLVSNINMKN